MTTTLLYNGTAALDFLEDSHTYYVTDSIRHLEWSSDLPSVTGVCSVISKPALIGWAVKMTAQHVERTLRPGVALDEVQIAGLVRDAKRARYRTSDEALDIGSIVHKWIEADCAGQKPDMPINEKARNSIESWLEWKERMKLEVMASEFRVYSREHAYVGTADLDIVVQGRRVLADIKTSKGIYPEYHLQTAAYMAARQEENPDNRYDGRAVVRVPKNGGPIDVAWRADFEADMGAFLGALSIWNWQRKEKAS